MKLSWQCTLLVCPVQFAASGNSQLTHPKHLMCHKQKGQSLEQNQNEVMKWKGFVASINSELLCAQSEDNVVFGQCKICAVSFHVWQLRSSNCAGFQGNWWTVAASWKEIENGEFEIIMIYATWSIFLQSELFSPLGIQGSKCCICLIHHQQAWGWVGGWRPRCAVSLSC